MSQKNIYIISLVIILQLLTTTLLGQVDSCWTVLLVKKNNTFTEKKDMAAFSKTGFYLYRNCIYEIQTNRGDHYSGRLIDIQPDTLSFSRFFNKNVASKVGIRQDTLKFHYRQLDKLSLIADRSLNLSTQYDLGAFNFIFKKDTRNCSLPSRWEKIFINDDMLYEIVPHLTEQGISYLFEERGATYYFYGTGINPILLKWI